MATHNTIIPVVLGAGGGGGGDVFGSTSWQTISEYTELQADKRYILDWQTNGQFDVLLPSNPPLGAEIVLMHGEGTVNPTTPPKVLRNGENIDFLAEDMNFDVDFVKITCVYINSTEGWRVTI